MPGKIDDFGPETLKRIEAKAIQIAAQLGIPRDFARATAAMDELTARRVKRIADEWDRQHSIDAAKKEQDKAVVKRGVLQILAGLGWIEKK